MTSDLNTPEPDKPPIRTSKKNTSLTNQIFLFCIVIIMTSLTFGFLTKSGQQAYDAWYDDLRMTRNWVNYKLGLPLAGTPDLAERKERLSEKGLKMGAPIFMRIFKLESELELWMRGKDGFKLFATYPICRWSGRLGPKLKEGDRQSPEGIYTVRQKQLNANSRWYKSFNLGYPNIYDKSYQRTGSYLMVHGGCSSIGCYAMTNEVMKEIWEIVLASYRRGNKIFTVHAFPFRMTSRNMRVYNQKKWAPFWKTLKPAYDLFNIAQVPPKVSICNKQYQFEEASKVDNSHAMDLKKQCREITIGSES